MLKNFFLYRPFLRNKRFWINYFTGSKFRTNTKSSLAMLIIPVPQNYILEAAGHILLFFAGVPQNDHPLCTPHPMKCFSQVNNLGDSILSLTNLSRCWSFRIILIKSWWKSEKVGSKFWRCLPEVSCKKVLPKKFK